MHWFVDNILELFVAAGRKISPAADAADRTPPDPYAPGEGEEDKDGFMIFSLPEGKSKKFKRMSDGRVVELLPTRISRFDDLIGDRALERGSTLLVSGGTGTGKTTFGLQMLYNAALKGERGIYISFEEEPAKIAKHMKKNFGWDFEALKKKSLVELVKFDPTRIARSVEEAMVRRTGSLRIDFRGMELPFLPDRIVVDSLSALSIAFGDEENYRKYIRELFDALEQFNSINFVISETEQNPKIYSRTGVEEFLADGVVVLYNLKVDRRRENALEILKLRSSKHEKKMVPYRITDKGFDITVGR